MLKSKTITFSISESPFAINPGFSYTLLNPFWDIDCSNYIVVSAIVSFNVNAPNGTPVSIWFKDVLNQTKQIDSVLVSNGRIVFDASYFFYFKNHFAGPIYIYNNSSSSITFYGSGHSVDIEYHNKDTIYKTENVLTKKLNDDVLFYFDYSTQDLFLRRTLLSGVTKYDVSICHSREMKDSTFLFMPKGWKFSFLDYLIIERNVSDEIETICYVDKDNVKHLLQLADLSNDVYYAIDGSGITIREIINSNLNTTTYELFNDFSLAKKTFNYDGLLISASDNNDNYINATYSTNSITVLDNCGNTITIEKNETTGNISLVVQHQDVPASNPGDPAYSLGPIPIKFTFTINSNNLLSSITSISRTDEIEYSSNRVSLYHTHDNYRLFFGYEVELLVSIGVTYNNITLEDCYIEYEYLKFVVGGYKDVEHYFIIDKYLNCASTGERINGNDRFPKIHYTNNSLSTKTIGRFDTKIGRTYKVGDSTSFIYNSNNSGTWEYTNFNEIDASNPLVIKENKKYIFKATLAKENNYPLDEAKNVRVELYNGNDMVASLDFNPLFDIQTAIVDFKSPITETANNKLKIKIICTGLNLLGAVAVSDVSIHEFKGLKETLYVNNICGINIGDGANATPISINNIDWYEFSETYGSIRSVLVGFSFSDLVKNYFAVEKNTHLFWSEDGHRLTYNSLDSNGPNVNTQFGGYVFKGHINLGGSSNLLFAKKVWVKDYVSNSVAKEMFDFSYIEKTNNGYELVTVKNIGDESKESRKVFNDIYNLISEIDFDNIETEYEYKTQNNHETNLVSNKTVSLSNSNESFSTSYTYDSRNRMATEESVIPGQTSSKHYFHTASFEPIFATFDELKIEEDNIYGLNLQKVTQITKANLTHYCNYSDINSYKFDNGEFVFAPFDDVLSDFEITRSTTNIVESFKIKISDDTQATLLTRSFVPSYPNDTLIISYNSGKVFTNSFDRYQRLFKATYTNSSNVTSDVFSVYYFDNKPTNLGDSSYNNEANFITYINQNNFDSYESAKLYKVYDYIANQIIDYDYYSDDKLKTILTKSSDGTSITSITYTYDFLDRCIKSQYAIEGNISFKKEIAYKDNFDDKVIQVKYTIGSHVFTQSITYDEYLRITSIENNSVNKVSFGYTPVVDSQYNQNVLNPVAQPLTYSSTYMNKSWNYYVFQHDAPGFVSYDKRGNIIAISYGMIYQYGSNNADRYYYDSNDRIIKEKNSKLNKTIIYSYDSYGNLTSAITKTFNEALIVSSECYYYDQTFKNKLTYYDNRLVTYDADFNILSVGNLFSFSWVRDHKLQSVTKNNITTSFEYNKDGVRISKTSPSSGTHKYYVEGNKIIAEKITNNNTTTTLIYLYGVDGVTGIYKDNEFYFFEKNQLGDVIELRYAMGVYAKYSYDAFGNCTVTDSNGNEISDLNDIAHLNPFRYRSYYYDRETDLYYCINRYYSPKLRRWISIDETKYFEPNTLGGMDLFAYCLNNPIKYIDPEGTMPEWAYWVIGASVIALFGLATLLTAGIAGIGVGTAFAAGFSGSAIGFGASGAAVTIASSAFAGAVIGASIGSVSGTLIGGLSTMSWSGAYAGLSRGFMIGAISGAISGAIRGAINYSNTTPLFRSVSQDEMIDLKSSHVFRSRGTMEGKFFWLSRESSFKFGTIYNQTNTIGIRVLKQFSNSTVEFFADLDSIGNAIYFTDLDYLMDIMKGIWFY